MVWTPFVKSNQIKSINTLPPPPLHGRRTSQPATDTHVSLTRSTAHPPPAVFLNTLPPPPLHSRPPFRPAVPLWLWGGWSRCIDIPPSRHPTVPPSRRPVIPLSRRPAALSSHCPAIPPSRRRPAVQPSRRPRPRPAVPPSCRPAVPPSRRLGPRRPMTFLGNAVVTASF